RWRKAAYRDLQRHFRQPLWLGEDSLQGKTILVYSEQGYGDTIQFCRYAAPLADSGARVVLQVQPPLKTLLTGLAGACRVIADGEALPAFDCHCPLMSLPMIFKTGLATIPAPRAYLYGDAQRSEAWQARLGPQSHPRIGIAWAGSSGHANDALRSIPLSRFLRLASPQAQFVSLQKDLPAAERRLLENQPRIMHFGALQDDFADTAALVANMDLVITVDTAVAHLAAAMGKPVWILLPFAPDWRWMLERSDSPWYPSARLLRQPAAGDWDSVIAAACRGIGLWLAAMRKK
ncbi:MAG TPA: glycosyltransferase family 9 protein, partial [Janthinobacterium sp.]|nr:glycosyltransferase family 9 protein [Janthinobacterium sp.]